jgi:hypothetical protein
MAIEKLYISHVDYNWNGYESKFLNANNLNKALMNDVKNNYHTSIEDLTLDNVQKTVQSANKIILIDLNLYTDNDQKEDYFQYGKLIRELFKVKDKVENFDWINELNYNFFNSTLLQRLDDDPKLWTAGCSVTHGTGVAYQDRWGSILSDKLSMKEISLSLPGRSIGWCADQILRSDIRLNDIVVWGLTNVSRVEYANKWIWHAVPASRYHALPKNLQHYNLNYFDSQTKLVCAIKNILQVKSYCEKIGAQLYLVNLLDSTWLTPVFDKLPTYIDLCADWGYNDSNYMSYLDLGSDRDHPGPKQHRYYAEQIFNLIKENKHGKTI